MKIVTIGEILVEIMAVEPGDGFGEPIALVGPFASGAPAIFIDQVARLGVSCAIVSCVGQDDFGAMCIRRLAADGVDVNAIEVDPERPTGSAFVRYCPDGGRSFVFNIRHSACASIRAGQSVRQVIAECTHLHVTGTALFSPAMVELTMEAIAAVRSRGRIVFFDPNARREMLDIPGIRAAFEQVLRNTDLFLPSGDELYLLTEAKGEAVAVSELLGRGVKAVVLKRGSAGASYFDREGQVSVPGLSVEEIDPTGAGDCFAGTFVTCWLQGRAPLAALALANAGGALAVRKKGPMEGTSSMEEVIAFAGAAPTSAGGDEI